MNIRRGMVRLWVALASLWAMAVMCSVGYRLGKHVAWDRAVADALPWALLPPAVLIPLLAMGGWVLAGFRGAAAPCAARPAGALPRSRADQAGAARGRGVELRHDGGAAQTTGGSVIAASNSN